MNYKPMLTLVGLVIALFGFVWLLQGIRILPGTFMAGSQFWATTGFLTVIVGLVIVGILRLRPKKE